MLYHIQLFLMEMVWTQALLMAITLQDQLLGKLPKEQMVLKFRIGQITFPMLLVRELTQELTVISIDYIHSELNLKEQQVDWEEDAKDLAQ